MAALEGYDLDVATVRLLSTHWNTIFRVDARDGKRYVLRISKPGYRDEVAIRTELAWLESLAREADVGVPRPVAGRDGRAVREVTVEGVPQGRFVTLFTWVSGRRSEDPPSSRTAFRMGQTAARLHASAAMFRPERPFLEERFDRIWNFGRAEVAERMLDAMPVGLAAAVREAIPLVERYLGEIYARPEEIVFLHGDLHAWNLRFERERVNVLDFDDSLWGHPVQDVGISIWSLLYFPRGTDLRAAFIEGYGSVRTWPGDWDRWIDAAVAHRALDMLAMTMRYGTLPEGEVARARRARTEELLEAL